MKKLSEFNNSTQQITILDLLYEPKMDEPGKVNHPRRMKVSIANEVLGFDLSVG